MDVVIRSGFSRMFEDSAIYDVKSFQGFAIVFSYDFAEARMEVG